jgi:hypothetical protein
MKESDISVANEQIVSDDVDTSRENKRTDIRELPKQVIAPSQRGGRSPVTKQ